MKFDLNFDSSFDININSSDLIGFSGFPQILQQMLAFSYFPILSQINFNKIFFFLFKVLPLI